MLVERNEAMERSHREHGPSGPHVPATAASPWPGFDRYGVENGPAAGPAERSYLVP